MKVTVDDIDIILTNMQIKIVDMQKTLDGIHYQLKLIKNMRREKEASE